MARPTIKRNPKRVENILTLCTLEKLSQTKLAEMIGIPQQSFNRSLRDNAVSDYTVDQIAEKFPKYTKDWLRGESPYMTAAEAFDAFYAMAEKRYDDNVTALQLLARRCGLEVTLLYQETGTDDIFLIRSADADLEATVTYTELCELVEDLTALAQSQLNRIIRKGSH